MPSLPLYLYGKHAVLAALDNPMRKVKRILITANARKEIDEKRLASFKNIQQVDNKKLDDILQTASVHQGIAIEVEPLKQPPLAQWLDRGEPKPILLLDQVSDPHNVGAILRSAAAFNAGAVIGTDRNAPQESGVMAKAASGALEIVPLIGVTNLAQAIELVKKAGYWVAGLDGHAKQHIADANLDAKTALILGAEGQGLRRLTTEHCDFLVKLPIAPQMESLNVSNAAAVALYDIYRRL